MAAASPPAPYQPDPTTFEEARTGAEAYLRARLSAKDQATDSQFTVPTIDLSPSFSPSLPARQLVASQIRAACTTSGFFYITHHGVPEKARQSVIHQTERFMSELSADKKEAIHTRNSTLGLGWEPGEYTSLAGDEETKEAFNFAYEEGFDRGGGDGLYRNLDGTRKNANLWPGEEDLPGFRAEVGEYYGAVLDLARHLFRLFALSLDLPETYFDAMTTHPGGIARLIYYPPSPVPQPDTSSSAPSIGLGAHSDYECFTLLLTSSTPGLEILQPSSAWHVASYVPGAFIVNVADFLMRWTNGLYKSTVHRVVNRSSDARYSVPFFFSVNYDAVVETLPTCLAEGEKSMWKPIKAGEYILQRLNATTRYGEGFKGNEAVFKKKY